VQNSPPRIDDRRVLAASTSLAPPRSDRFGTLGLARGIKPGDGAEQAYGSNIKSAAIVRETNGLEALGI
jgi:hypothetical protein